MSSETIFFNFTELIKTSLKLLQLYTQKNYNKNKKILQITILLCITLVFYHVLQYPSQALVLFYYFSLDSRTSHFWWKQHFVQDQPGTISDLFREERSVL